MGRLPFLKTDKPFISHIVSACFFWTGSLFSALKPPETIFKVIFWLGYFNSCLNPIIYPCSSKEFKRAFIQILKCQCHRRKQLGWWAYSYRNWNRCSFEHPRKDSLEDSGSFLSGSQRTLSSASPSPGYLSKITHPHMEMCTFQEWKNSSSFLSPLQESSRQKDPYQFFTFNLLPEHNGHIAASSQASSNRDPEAICDTLNGKTDCKANRMLDWSDSEPSSQSQVSSYAICLTFSPGEERDLCTISQHVIRRKPARNRQINVTRVAKSRG